MLFLVIERFRPGCVEEVYRRFRERGRMAPAGVRYVSSWVELDFRRCFQVMEVDDEALLSAWMDNWRDLVEFEVVPVRTSEEAARRIGNGIGEGARGGAAGAGTARPSIRLVPIDAALRDALASPGADLAATHGVSVGDRPDLVREVVAQTLALHARVPRAPEWGGFLVADPVRAIVVGTCGYAHGPEADGTVEIAYFTFPSFERQGWATAMAAELLARGRASPDVRAVVAHTLPEENGSTRILRRLGLRCVGPVEHPADGTIWRWTDRSAEPGEIGA